MNKTSDTTDVASRGNDIFLPLLAYALRRVKKSAVTLRPQIAYFVSERAANSRRAGNISRRCSTIGRKCRVSSEPSSAYREILVFARGQQTRNPADSLVAKKRNGEKKKRRRNPIRTGRKYRRCGCTHPAQRQSEIPLIGRRSQRSV